MLSSSALLARSHSSSARASPSKFGVQFLYGPRLIGYANQNLVVTTVAGTGNAAAVQRRNVVLWQGRRFLAQRAHLR
jgi:hypothetical protein